MSVIEWSIHLDVLNIVFQKCGFPQVDLFVTKLTRTCPQFCSDLGYSQGSLLDAFLLS